MVKCPNCKHTKAKQVDACFCDKCGTIMRPAKEEPKEKEKDKWPKSTEKTEQ